MRCFKLSVLFPAAVLCLLAAGCQDPSTPEQGQKKTADAEALTRLEQKIGYAIGLDIGSNFAKNGFPLDDQAVLLGLRDARNQAEPRLSQEEMAQALMDFQQQAQQQMLERHEKMITENGAKAKAYLEENSHRDGVQVLESGLQYRVEQAGSGNTPQADDVVRVHYRGMTSDGEEFDSSYRRGEPVEFPVSAVIPGWSEALQLMKEGDKWQLVIPPALAYGEEGRGEAIAPNSLLIFEVELLEVVKAAEAAEAETLDAAPEQEKPAVE
ncbi:MAG: FKBP-type peptidyl-prolyl cis-trans isomerase [Desulfuromonadaceae bacterium]|nr:FKBP-type peptidyl-prolyl cis-trans isomerase [Desulfuromonadaceae bacterium]